MNRRATTLLSWGCVLALAAMGTTGEVHADTPKAAGQSSLRLRAAKKTLVLGVDPHTTLTITSDRPIDAGRLRARAHHGKVGKIRRLGSKRFSMRYTPPAVSRPLRDQVTVWATGAGAGNPDAILLSLWHPRVVRARVTPHARAHFEVGSRSYEQLRAGGHGQVECRLEVPPGVRQATVVWVDEGGDTQRRPVSIGASEAPPVAEVVLPRTRLPADGQATTAVYLLALDPRWNMRSSAPPRAQASQGRFGKAQRVRAGIYRLDYQAPLRLSEAEVNLRVRFRNSAPKQRTLALTAPFVGRLSLEISAGELPANVNASVIVTARLTTPDGAPVGGEAIQFLTDAGRLSAPREEAPGLHRTVLTGPWQGAEKATVRALGPGELASEVSIALRPPERFRVESDRNRLVAGGPPAEVIVEARDIDGLRVPDGTLILAEARGAEVPRQVPVEDGLARIPVRPGDKAGKVEATFSFEELSETLEFEVAPADPARIHLAAKRHSLLADGRDKVEVVARVEDRYGNAVRDARLTMNSDTGRLEGLTGADDGYYRTVYTAPGHRRPGQARIEVAGPSDLRAELPITLEGVPHDWAFAAKLGGAWNGSSFGAVSARLEAGRRVTPWLPKLLGTWSVSYTGGSVNQRQPASVDPNAGAEAQAESGLPMAVDIELELHQIEFALGPAYELPSFAGFNPSVGAAAELTMLYLVLKSDLQSTVDELRWTPGFHLRAELERSVGYGAMLLDLRYTWRDGSGARLASGSLGGPGLSLGYRLRL